MYVHIILLFKFLFTVISHLYGKEGREANKIDTKSVVIDFNLFEQLATNNFSENVMSNIQSFVETLNNLKNTGIPLSTN